MSEQTPPPIATNAPRRSISASVAARQTVNTDFMVFVRSVQLNTSQDGFKPTLAKAARISLP
jgi:hypothetical protein